VMVKNIGQGIIADQTKMREGFVITKVNDTKVSSVDELKDALRQAGNSAIITGVYPQNPSQTYQYALNDLSGAE